ncbi:MAG: DUF5777 family beta-barrel protein [Candidatus Poribacteria bacterium]
MKKIIILSIVMFFIPYALIAYDDSGGLNLKGITALKTGQLEFRIDHRFYGKINEKPIDTFFGLYSGADVSIDLRYLLWSTFEINTSFKRYENENTIGLSYAVLFPMVKGQIDAQLFSYKHYNIDIQKEERITNAFVLLSLQTDQLMKVITPTVNIGYDAENKEIGAGIGIAIIVLKDKGTMQKLALLGEYYPTKLENSDNCYCFGIRVETYGHNFDFLLGNNSNIGVRRLMLGNPKIIGVDSGLYFGFNLKRLIE